MSAARKARCRRCTSARQRRQPHSKLRRCTHIDAGPRDEKGRGRGAGAFLALVRSGCGTGARYLAGLTATAKAADFKPAGWMIISLRMWRAQRELWRNRRRLTSSVMPVRCKVPLQVGETKAPHKKRKGHRGWAAGLGAIAASSATADAPLVMKRGPRGCRRGRLKPVDSAWHFTGLWSVAANAKATKDNCCGVGDVSGGLRCRGHCRDRPFGSPERLG